MRANLSPFRPRFGCLWIPQFPAWAALAASPELASCLIIVHQRGRVVALFPYALHCGACEGWTLRRAATLVPKAALSSKLIACGTTRVLAGGARGRRRHR